MTTFWKPRVTHDGTMRLAIIAHGTAALTPSELGALRQPRNERSAPSLGPRFHKLKPQFLKHSEDQTLAALAAASAALDDFGPGEDFGSWAVVSSTRYLGRGAFAAVIDKYQIDGPWGVSVQAIPHGSPHAVASTLSLAMGIHGPCIGVGAATGDESQALLSAASLLQDRRRPGAWLLFTAWSPESPTDDSGTPAAEAVCLAAALAVVHPAVYAPDNMEILGQIEFRPVGPDEALPTLAEAHGLPALGLTEFLAGCDSDLARWHCRASADLRIAIDRPATRIGVATEPLAGRLTEPPRRALAA